MNQDAWKHSLDTDDQHRKEAMCIQQHESEHPRIACPSRMALATLNLVD
ncbi:MAG: hypothetical protein VW874_07380 [Gammaproteobacteria bacterium]